MFLCLKGGLEILVKDLQKWQSHAAITWKPLVLMFLSNTVSHPLQSPCLLGTQAAWQLTTISKWALDIQHLCSTLDCSWLIKEIFQHCYCSNLESCQGWLSSEWNPHLQVQKNPMLNVATAAGTGCKHIIHRGFLSDMLRLWTGISKY